MTGSTNLVRFVRLGGEFDPFGSITGASQHAIMLLGFRQVLDLFTVHPESMLGLKEKLNEIKHRCNPERNRP